MITWKILEIGAKDGVITSAKYHAAIQEGDLIVETEGNCDFLDITVQTPFAEVTEAQVAEWIKKETVKNGQTSIEYRLQEQLEVLKNQEAVKAPWVKNVYKPTL